ncbi:hypothetical protein PUN28_011637 [Cardiocondyla obscurior]|uniref:Uncharacterized protein n=1 Tax=Cardiocondyla obscurior TaxID=286306 RepID=A0AAW2FGZ2_9HYME
MVIKVKERYGEEGREVRRREKRAQTQYLRTEPSDRSRFDFEEGAEEEWRTGTKKRHNSIDQGSMRASGRNPFVRSVGPERAKKRKRERSKRKRKRDIAK